MGKNSNDMEGKLLRITHPKLYDHLIEELSSANIHPFDIHATSRRTSTGTEIQICFGEKYQRESTQTFSESVISGAGSEFFKFCKEIADMCKETMFADYMKMIKL